MLATAGRRGDHRRRSITDPLGGIQRPSAGKRRRPPETPPGRRRRAGHGSTRSWRAWSAGAPAVAPPSVSSYNSRSISGSAHPATCAARMAANSRGEGRPGRAPADIGDERDCLGVVGPSPGRADLTRCLNSSAATGSDNEQSGCRVPRARRGALLVMSTCTTVVRSSNAPTAGAAASNGSNVSSTEQRPLVSARHQRRQWPVTRQQTPPTAAATAAGAGSGWRKPRRLDPRHRPGASVSSAHAHLGPPAATSRCRPCRSSSAVSPLSSCGAVGTPRATRRRPSIGVRRRPRQSLTHPGRRPLPPQALPTPIRRLEHPSGQGCRGRSASASAHQAVAGYASRRPRSMSAAARSQTPARSPSSACVTARRRGEPATARRT